MTIAAVTYSSLVLLVEPQLAAIARRAAPPPTAVQATSAHCRRLTPLHLQASVKPGGALCEGFFVDVGDLPWREPINDGR